MHANHKLRAFYYLLKSINQKTKLMNNYHSEIQKFIMKFLDDIKKFNSDKINEESNVFLHVLDHINLIQE